MVWCAQCAEDVEVEADDANGFSCCVQCGRVVEDTAFSSDVMFAKGADGEGELVGQIVGASGEARGLGRYSGGRMWAGGMDSHEAAVSRGRHEISALVEALRISPSSEATETAHRFYKLALQRGFTRGRRVNQVAAVCLYIFCRLEQRPYMLIDFSDHLSINVYALGAVFLQMLRLLRLDEHATFTKPIDPSLFLNRFVDRLRLPTPELKRKLTNTAMRLVQSMKRDWMLTGRRPSGICGAALFLAAHIHGVEKTKKDIMAIVHIGWSTVEKRVLELAETRDAELTLRQLDARDADMEQQRELLLLEYERQAVENPQAPPPALRLTAGAAAGPSGAEGDGGEGGAEGAGADGALALSSEPDPNEAGRACEHVRLGAPLLAHGMCRGCYEEYLKVTGAQAREGTQDPPCYTRNLRNAVKRRVREQFQATRGKPLALEGPEAALRLTGGTADEQDELDERRRRHLENEAALEAAERGEGEQGGGAEEEQAGAGPSTSAGATGAAEGAGGGGAGGGDGSDVEEEEDFDQALHSSELQGLAKALGGEAAAVATAPLQQRPKRARAAAAAAPVSPAGGGPAAGGDAAAAAGEGGAGAASVKRVRFNLEGEAAGGQAEAGQAAQAEGEAGPSGSGAAADADAGPSTSAAGAAAPDAAADGAAPAAADGGGGPSTSTSGAVTAVPAAPRAVVAAGGGDASDDNLSDVDDDAIAGYLATREEASMREALWVEMNKDWIEKQEAKRAAAEAAAADPSKSDSGKNKRRYTKKTKVDLPAAEDAAGATRNLLEAKKLSNKINYNALADLFGSGSGAAGSEGGGEEEAAAGEREASPSGAAAGASGRGGGAGAGAGGRQRGRAARSTSPELGGGGAGGRGAGEWTGGGGGGGDDEPVVAAALAKRAADRAKAQEEDASRYAAALEEETRRRGGGGGGLGGGFLDALSFARPDTGGGRSRPQGLSLRPRGR